MNRPGMPQTPQDSHHQTIRLLASGIADAVTDQGLNAAVRYKAATVLGQLGGVVHRDALAHCAASDPDPHVKERAQGGLALLSARLEPNETVTGAPDE